MISFLSLALLGDFEFTFLAVQRVRADRVLELDHREEDLIQSALAIEVQNVDVAGRLPDPMRSILRLEHQSRRPVHFGEDDRAGSCEG